MQIECALPPSNERERHIAGIVRRFQQILRAENITDIADSALAEIAAEKLDAA